MLQSPEKVKKPTGQPPRASEGHAKNCVPVIQRTYPNGIGEQSGSDTDTDSGYGGEPEKRDPKVQWSECQTREGELKHALSERTGASIKQEGGEPQAKKLRSDSPEEEIFSGHVAGGPGSYMSFSPNQHPFCLPFYLIPPGAAAAAAYLPMLEKCWYPGGVSVMYPGMSPSAASLSPDSHPSSLVMSPTAGSPVPSQTSRDSSALLHA